MRTNIDNGFIEPITASMLFAGGRHRDGANRCYYCGAPCDGAYSRDDRVGDTFTNRDIVKHPNSKHVCAGCYLSTGNGDGDLPMVDGTVKAFTTPRGMAPRMYSWLLTKGTPLAFTKVHIATVREMLADVAKLPDPPFAWILSDTGQKQLIFRAPVALDKSHFDLLLEDSVIEVSPDALRDRLALASEISTKIGKPTLSALPSFGAYAAASKAGLPVEALRLWEAVREEPLSKLAAWLAPPKNKGAV